MLFGSIVIGIVNIHPSRWFHLSFLVAGAVASGLYYYAFCADYTVYSTVAAAAAGDIMLMVRFQQTSFKRCSWPTTDPRGYLILLQLPHPNQGTPKPTTSHLSIALSESHGRKFLLSGSSSSSLGQMVS